MDLINKNVHDDPDGNLHVIPCDEFHKESESCYCNPIWDKENKKEYLRGEANCKLFIHRTISEIKQ